MSDDVEETRFPQPKLFKSATVWLGDSAVAIALVVTWVEILVVALVVTLLYTSFTARARTPVRDAVGWDTLRIDGNRADKVVLFPHADHKKRLGEDKKACMTCHHMSKPMDGPTSCHVCHRDMYLSISMFDHPSHQQVLGGNESCHECHTRDKAKENAKPCKECHKGYTKEPEEYVARSYESAMHSRCISCHKKEAKKVGKPNLWKCVNCHKDEAAKMVAQVVPAAIDQ